ncbi:hypothetical protein XELAEV_18047787mg [Xenopus laevis]|uniref:Unconventional myosin-XV n=1 Tax=Xenopus laevis TaxID=8355 RepID=A0A974H1V5_XENLA|nr:hypothetical protein XELAEV_18047787mg [Xenopus laevis]
MGGKKGDTKPAKKGGGKESAASSKPAPKKDEKKGGKGKEKDDKKKGKDAKKAKKEVTSDSEEASEAELIKQASEESKNEEEEEDESEVDARRRRGREKGVVALKGASKAMAGMNQGNRRKGQPAMAGLAKKPAQPPTKKKSLKATSRLFMKFRQMNPRRSKKGHFKAASKLLTGFRKKLVPSSLLNKKKKSVAMLKNTSKLMLGLRKSLKKQPPKPQPSDGTKQKPTFMLLRLGGNSSKTDQKGPGGLLSGLFGRKKAKNKFQPKAKVLTKVSAAASWLTKKFLSKKRGFSENDKAIQEAWLSRMGAQKLPFPTQDEFRRYQANLQRFPGVHRFHGQNEDVYGNPKNFEAYHQRFPTQSYTPQGPGRYDDPSMEYYDYGNEDYGYDDQGYLGNENRFPYGYDSYPGEELGYDDYPEYQMDEDYPSYEENMEYYGEDSHLLRSQNSRFDYQVDVHNPPNTYSGYDFEENEMGYYEDAMNPYGTMENGRNPFLSFSDQSNYSDFNDVDEYISTNATPNYRDYPVSPYAEPLNPYAQPMDDVMETDEAMVGRDVNYYEDQDMEEETPSTLSINRKYKLFPRPQVKLFGREKLDVPLPPSPHISFTDYDEEEEEEEEDEPLIPPARQQRNFRQPPNKSLFAKSVQRNYGQPCARGVQNVLFAKPVGKRFSGYHQENCQENESLDFSPRAFGSPLGQFMKETLNPKPILKHSGTRRNTQPPSEPPYRNAFAESNVPRTPSPQPSLKLFKGPLMQGGYQEQNTPSAQQNWSQRNTQLPSQPPNRNAFVESNVPQTSSPRPSLKYMKGPVNHVGFQKQNAPSAQQLENLQNNLEHEPYHKRFGLKLAGMDSSNVSRKPTFSASNNNNTEAKPSPQPTRQSPQPVQKFYNHGKNVQMPPSPNLSTRQRPLSPKPTMNAFGLNKSNANSHSQQGQINPPMHSPMRQKDLTSSPQMTRSPTPTRMTHWSSNGRNQNASPNMPSNIAPPSPQRLVRMGDSFRGERVSNPSSQMSIKSPYPASPYSASPQLSPVLQRSNSNMKRGFRMPASPQPTRRHLDNINSDFYHANESDHEMSFSQQMSRSIGDTVDEQQETFMQGWPRDNEPPTEAVKPLMGGSFMMHLKQSGVTAPSNPLPQKGSVSRMSLGNTRTSPSPHRQASSDLMARESQRSSSPSRSFSEQSILPDLGRYDSMRSTSRTIPSNPMAQMINQQESQHILSGDSQMSSKSPVMGRNGIMVGTTRMSSPNIGAPQGNHNLFSRDPEQSVMGRYDSMRGTSNQPPSSPMSHMLQNQGSSPFLSRKPQSASLQSTAFSEQPQSHSKARFDTIRGQSSLPHPNTGIEMLHRQDSILNSREFQDVSSQFSERPKSPTMKKNSLRGNDVPSPSNSTPFYKRVGHPLVGLSQAPPSPAQLSMHRKLSPPVSRAPKNIITDPPFVGYEPLTAGQTQRSMGDINSISGSYDPPQSTSYDNLRRSPTATSLQSPMFYKGPSKPSRLPSPQMGLKSLGGFMAESLNQVLPGSPITKPNIFMEYQGPATMAGASYSVPRSPHPRGMYMGSGPIRAPIDFYNGESEDGMGRYAVVMPQVQRMGSFKGRGTLRKPPWQRQDTVNFHEMQGTWSSNKSAHMPWSNSMRGESNRARGRASGYPAHRGGMSPRNVQQMANKDQKPQLQDKPAGKPQSMGREEQNEEHGFHDMTQLEDLQEASVLDNLRKRFDREIIYTYIGSILLSMNPYKMLNLYGTDHVLKYEGKALGENPPHLFAIANVAYTKLMDAKNNQCIIISGESGSGKTEATKLVLQYLVAINQRRGVKNKILEATPLLESFGNAKTVRNDNSSRFGKFIEIYLEEGVICGAITSQYLLEKSRIVFQANNERNYHIFYEMLAGLPSQQKQMFYLQDAETYYYLNQGCNCDIPAKSDADDFRRLLNAMESLSFTGEEQDSIFRILSSILHLGNVYFEKHEETMREKILTPLTVESAVDARDAIAKILYSLLFSWLTERINKLVYPKQDALSIAILDIFGFEDLSFNSFEQLCINYANEYLQFFFNKIIFREEQEEYIREQIDWREISFSDNQACIDIISQKPHGILRILDDQSGFPQATDHTFLQKCHYQHGTSDLYCKPKMPLPEFGIKHFAGKVTYQVHQFLDKNYDQVRQDVLDLFVNSKIKVVANLFFSHAQVLAQQKTMMGKGNTVTRKYKASTVAAKFQQSLLELVEKMERCNPFFVRCMKPNSRKEPNLFEADIVTSQLKYSGILETIRIRKEGFPVRMSFSFFLSRYRCVMDLGRNVRIDGQTCVTALKKLCPSATPSMYCIGVSKLFMKEKVYQLLESQRDQFMNKFAVTLQRYSRGYLTRKRFYILRYRIIQLQALARGYLARRKFYNWRKIMTMFRAVVRIYVNRRKFLRELTKREVVNVTHLELPAELAGLLRSTTATKNLTLDFVLPIQSPRVEADTQLTLPLDINNYLMFKYVRVFFKEPLFGMLTVPHGSSLLPVEDDLRQHAISSFKLILRFMGDPYLGGTQEILFGNYIVQKGLSNIGLRDEILAQVANQVWRNSNPNNEERGWYLLACCLSTFAPSPNLDKYLLKYVSDYAHDGYKPVCQHKLIQAIQKSQQGSETSRNFPPSQLEWTASRERANMAMDVHFFDGEKISCPIHSWTDGEEIAGDVLRHRGVKEGYRGWSVSLKEGGQWTELAGQDYVLDLICNMELPRDFPKQKSYFITTSETIQENISHPSAVFGNSGEAGESVPPPSTAKAPSVPRQDSEGYHNADSDSVSEPQSQKGMDNYLDSLFDPVLSYGNGVSLDAQQQAYINQQAILLAQQMTMQAMAIQQQMVNNRPSNPHHPDDLIQHSAMNSEHHPESSHNKNILNRYKQPDLADYSLLPSYRKQPEHFFGRIIDPHEEALNMLNRQRPTHLLTRPTPVSNMSYVPKAPRDTVAFVKPVPSIKTKTPVAKPPVSHVRPTTAPTVTVNRELSEEQENIQTQLHRQYSEEYYTYTNVLWRIYIRKEVFYPRDSFNNPLTLDLIFKQIINDTLTENCIRISKEERQKMRSLLAGFRLDSINAIADESVKKKIVTVAREELEVYFSRLFPAAGSEGTGVQFLGVSHVGIKLLKLLKRSGSTPEQLRVLRSYSYTDIMFVTVLSKNMLEFNLTNEKLVLFSSRSSQVKTMIDCFLTELKKDSNYVVAVQNYVTEDKSFLSFHKGDIIRLQALDGLEKGQNYGFVVRKKVMYLEELKHGTQDFGWKFGAIHSRAGLLPAECVQPVAAPDFVNLPADRKEEPRNRQSRAAASAAVAVAVASTAVAHEFDRKMDGSPTPSEYAESLDEYTDPNTSEIMLQGSPYNMVEFAKKYFREGQRLAAQDKSQKMSGDSSKQGSKKSKEPKDLEEMLKFTKTPIQESLIEFSDGSMNRIAADVFTGIMKFMGDLPLKGQSELDAVYSVLKLCGEHEVMKDEGYCQIMKQITDNTSSNTDSCQRGWRLLFILTAYYKCSEVLKPYLFNFLQDTCRSPGLHYQGIAKACEQNLRKTIQYGGRTEYPSAIELKAMVAGRSSKRQLFLLPGGIERHLKIKTCSVAFDVIEEICMEMGVHKDEAFHEYAIFAVTNRGQNVRPLNRKEYILDVSAEMEQTDSNYMFWFRRIIWAQQLKFENELYVTMHYNQVLPDYLKGLFNVVAHIKPTEQQFQQISRLAALQHRAKDSVYLPTAREVQDYIPSQFYKVLKPQSWLNMVMQHMQQIQPLSPHQGRAQFLGIVSDFPMFGSSFFYIQSCSNNTVIAPCILAVNQNGLNFLNKETHELVVTFPLSNIQSTRTQRPASGFSYPYVDVMLGDVMSQRVTQLQLEQGLELCRVVATHMENLLQSRDKHLTLPPSDITLL